MKLFAGGVTGRARWLAVFMFLFAVCSAAPVLADPSEPPSTESPEAIVLPPSAMEDVPPGLPGAEDITKAFDEADEQDAKRDEYLESPVAVSERETSRTAYVDSTPEEATQLLVDEFAEQLADLNGDPARFLSDAALLKPLGETGAAVASVEGGKQLLEAGVPVRAENEEGDLHKVDLSLESTPNGYEPANPLVDLSIGASAETGIEVGDAGLIVTQAGSEEDSLARLLGEKNIFYPEVQDGIDTDLLVAPIAGGVELFDQLRSPDSPEWLRFHLDLPAGAELRSDGNGGAEVISDTGSSLAYVPTPFALDAQGSEVPVELSVEDDSLVLHTPHREGDFAYPILVDPQIVEDWVNSNVNWNNGNQQSIQALESGGPWKWNSNVSYIYGSTWCIYTCWGSHRGLYVSTPNGAWGANLFGQWSYSAPNASSYLANAWINPFWRDNHNCSKAQYPEPHDYDGMWDETSWSKFENNKANDVGSTNLESWGRALIIGMGSGNGGQIPCWRDVMAGGVAIWLDDWDAPYLTSVTGLPTGWIKKDETPRTINVTASDAGLGVQSVRLISPGDKEWGWNQSSCTGLWNDRCQTSRSGQVTFNTSGSPFQGKVSFGVQALDPTGKGYHSQEYDLLLDGTSPLIDLSGQLASVTQEQGPDEHSPEEGDDELSLPTYKLNIEATDGSESQLRSGVKEIKVFLDDKTSPEEVKTQSCPAGSCPMTMAYTLKLFDLAPGEHKLKVVAIDHAGNETKPERKVEFEYVPATGLKDEYVLQHIQLPDGKDHSEEAEPHGPELAVNVMNGNLVYHERDFEVQAPRADLELERFYNSQLPDGEDTEWGHGWTVAQTPELTPEDAPEPESAEMLGASGFIEGSVDLPTSPEEEQFDPEMQATISQTEEAGYEVSYEAKDEVSIFNAEGQIEETLYPSGAAVKYGEIEEESEGIEEEPEEENPRPVRTFGNGQLGNPYGVAVDPAGNVWVADTGNNRIQRFNSRGQYLGQLGSKGSGNGQFNTPYGIAADSAGNIWVADSGNSRIQKFNSKGEYLSKFGTFGKGNGQFNLPFDIATDAEGNIWVADSWNDRVQKFNSKGEYLSQFGSKGAGNGLFFSPFGIAIDHQGTIWVSDNGGERVQKFNAKGEYLSKFDSEGMSYGVAPDAAGNIWVVNFYIGGFARFNTEDEQLSKFGSSGSGIGQIAGPTGIDIDAAAGRILIADTFHHQIQEFSIAKEPVEEEPEFVRSVGSKGTGSAQFAAPTGVAADAEGNVWVVDSENNRVQKFNAKGEYLSKFGSKGTGNGQFNNPYGVATDAIGNVWVTDSGNNRVQKFNAKGEYVSQFGSTGTGIGQFNTPYGIAVDSAGYVWVTDSGNARVQRFTPKGEYWTQFGSKGSGNGQFAFPLAIAVDAFDSVWVADIGNGRIQRFNAKGECLSKLDSSQWSFGLTADEGGNIWVSELFPGHVKKFNSKGEYMGDFGSTGTGNGQFQAPTAMTIDPTGNIWVADSGNSRVQEFSRFSPPDEQPPPAPQMLSGMAVVDPGSSNDPSATINVDEGLVSSVEGEEAGTYDYDYDEGMLSEKEDAEGETTYGYDAGERLNEIELPIGTTATITYDTTSRVTEITVDPAGSEGPETTHFWYGAEPRETRVWGGGNPEVIYSIGEDGSVFKWRYAEVAPAFDSISGSLWASRNSTKPIENKDHTLFVTGSSQHQIAEIQVLINGTTAVAEKACEDNSEPPSHPCEHVTLEWVTHAASHPAGQLDIEALVTDFLGHTTAERFFVTIPQQPPPNPEAQVPPTFAQTKLFREDFGLDLDLNGNEEAITQRILNLLYQWELQEPVAVMSAETWGVPLRPSDVVEMEYRAQYVVQMGKSINDWAQSHKSTYAGYYVDHRHGGTIHVGFTEDQTDQILTLKQEAELLAPDRLAGFTPSPTHAYDSMLELLNEAAAAAVSKSMGSSVPSLSIDTEANTVMVGAADVTKVSNFLVDNFGASAPFTVFHDTPEVSESYVIPPTTHRFRDHGRMTAGDHIGGPIFSCETTATGYCRWRCTAGFGAREDRGTKPNGVTISAAFLLTAGHCYEKGTSVYRPKDTTTLKAPELGVSKRNVWMPKPAEGSRIDAGAIRLDDENLIPRWIYKGWKDEKPLLGPIYGVEKAAVGMPVCQSGWKTNRVVCSDIEDSSLEFRPDVGEYIFMLPFKAGGEGGDSGAPVWNPDTKKAIGLGVYGNWKRTWFTPILTPEKVSPEVAPGLLSALSDINPLRIETSP